MVIDRDDAPLPAGTMVGEYRIAEPIGEGGMGAVYRAVHPVLEREAAIKVIKAQFAFHRDSAARFEHEARLLGKLRHPGIIDVFGFGSLPDGRLYYTMELLRGQTLCGRLREGPLDLRETVMLTIRVGAALDAAHRKEIVHRDVKPSNIFLQSNVRGGVVLLDFGVAKLLTMDMNLTRVGQMAGSPPYMSPEQCRGSVVDHRSDIYSLALVVYECLTGQMAFSGPTAEVVSRQLDDPPPRLSDLAPQYAHLDSLLLRALSKDPAQRQQRASELAVQLAESCGMDPRRLDEPLAFVGTTEVVATGAPEPAGAAPARAPAPVDAMAMAETLLEGDTVPHRRVDPHTVLFHDTLPPVGPAVEEAAAAMDVNDTVTDPPSEAPEPVVRTSTALPRRSRRSFLAVGLFLGVVALLGVAIAVGLARSGLDATAEAPAAVVPAAAPLPDAAPAGARKDSASPDTTADAASPDTAPVAPDARGAPDWAWPRPPRRQQTPPAPGLKPPQKPASRPRPRRPAPKRKPAPKLKPPAPKPKRKEGDQIRF